MNPSFYISAQISQWIDGQARALAESISATSPKSRVAEGGNGAGGISGLASFGANLVGWSGSALIAWTGVAAIVGTAQGTGVATISASGGLISNVLTALMTLGTLLSAWLAAIGEVFFYLTGAIAIAVFLYGHLMQGPDKVMSVIGASLSSPGAPSHAGATPGDPVARGLGAASERIGGRRGEVGGVGSGNSGAGGNESGGVTKAPGSQSTS